VLVYPVPFLDPDTARHALSDDDEPLPRSHEAVLGAAMHRIRRDVASRRESVSSLRSVVMAHAFVVAGSEQEVDRSDSERDIRVGGADSVASEIFSGVDYVALGHLHGPQQIRNPGGPTTRYSGSPLAYSFSEESHVKSVTIVEIDADGSVSAELVPAPVPRRLRTITGDIAALIEDEGLADAADDWVRAIVTDTRRPENPMEVLRTRFPHTIELTWSPHVDGEPLPDVTPRVDPTSSDPVEVVMSFVEHVTTEPATQAERALIEESVERVRIAEAAR